MKKVIFSFAILISTLGHRVSAQAPAIPPPPQFDPEVVALVDKAKAQMEAGDYEGANRTFRKALATKQVLPTSMSYFFAKTLYVIHQNQNAKNFVEKYLQLAGRSGDYYEEAITLKKLIDDQFEAIKNCEYCNLSGYRYVVCDNCNGLGVTVETCYNCNGNGYVTCPKCLGKGVLITTTPFGELLYTSCDLCDSKGYIVCPVCHGEKELSGRCPVCLGSGKKVSNIICNHLPEQK